MNYYNKEDVKKAREMDLFTYLSYYEPDNLRHVSGSVYCTREHDSLIINNGKWCWFSQGIGGRCALDYLRKVKGLSFYEAVDRIIGNNATPLPPPKPIQTTPKVFVMPEISDDTTRVRKYLTGRGIDPEIIDWCIKRKLIYETTKYGNALFVGYDRQGLPKYGAVRSTCDGYKGDVKGSDKRFSFKLVRADSPRKVHVFESAPDLLSYATCVKLRGNNWRKESYLSLGGIGGNSIPKALEQFLKDYPDISHIYLHLDNDEPGRNFTSKIVEILKTKYYVRDYPPPSGKDYNDYLKSQIAQGKHQDPVR